jgi:hypothetical protein
MITKEEIEKAFENIANTKFKPETRILHPQEYRDLRYAAYVLDWYRITNWFQRWFALIWGLWPDYSDIAGRVEIEIENMYKQQESKLHENLLVIF